LPSKGSIRTRPKLARGLAVLLLAFGAAYYGTLIYPELVPAKLLLGAAPITYLALANGIVYGLAGLLIVSILYWGSSYK
jgi:hypothetical protein